ncbi:putative capsid protein [Odonata-associated circular virus-10]|uniref:putative capsid protein n=1 Tax=Odonata-associated circular virus-10 TaxID=1592110 RepID=UPI0005860660|nr:putative capsid protein [Odonata-associated circular virus-10]AJD07515.1 putative capsid protein [Odonata-associated circular virus-10]
MINRAVMKKSETKNLVASSENIQLYHNNGAVSGAGGSTAAVIFNPWDAIGQGLTVRNRIGNEIYPRGMAVRMELSNKLDRPNLTYRIIVAVIPKYYNNTVSSAAFDPRDNNASMNWMISWWKQDSGIKILYDKSARAQLGFYAVPSADGDQDGKEASKVVKLYIKSRRGQKLMWGQDQRLVNNPMIMWVIRSDLYGTLNTDNVASCAINTKHYWKDR